MVQGVSASIVAPDQSKTTGKGAPATGEPIVHFERSRGVVEVRLKDVDSLFDRVAPPTFPHGGPMLDNNVATFLVDTAREDRRSPNIEIALTFGTPALRPEEESGTRAQIHSFFSNNAEMAELSNRVNRTEGLGSLRYSIPVVAAAAFVVGVFSVPSTVGVPAYLSELTYLVALVVIWLMLWDPLEKLLFDSYFIRLRIRALQKLAAAKVTFAYRAGAVAPGGTAPVDNSPLETVQRFIDGT